MLYRHMNIKICIAKQELQYTGYSLSHTYAPLTKSAILTFKSNILQHSRPSHVRKITPSTFSEAFNLGQANCHSANTSYTVNVPRWTSHKWFITTHTHNQGKISHNSRLQAPIPEVDRTNVRWTLSCTGAAMSNAVYRTSPVLAKRSIRQSATIFIYFANSWVLDPKICYYFIVATLASADISKNHLHHWKTDSNTWCRCSNCLTAVGLNIKLAWKYWRSFCVNSHQPTHPLKQRWYSCRSTYSYTAIYLWT